MKIAIVGTGISGLTCGYYLNKNHDITLYEANDYIGGHTATVDVELNGHSFAVDTGFIVYNDRTYPNFIQLMEEIGVKGLATEMSFSVSNQANGLEYNGHTLTTLFAQKRNWFKPRFYKFILDILRFNKLVKAHAGDLGEDHQQSEQTLGDFLNQHGFNDYFSDNYILPMGAAIWSSTLADMRAFPLDFFARFFLNHGLLDVVNRPQWYVIEGGSKQYIPALTRAFADRIRLSAPIQSVWRDVNGVHLMVNGTVESYDQVIFACHSDQALGLLGDATAQEQEVLSALAYQNNQVILHTDTSLLPQRKAAWAAWNYRLTGDEQEQKTQPTLTYNMNILQQIECEETFCVSLNSEMHIDPSKILRTFNYSHPVFNHDSMRAQAQRDTINGCVNAWFCGAYWYNGFHEDGVRSALDVVKAIEEQSASLITPLEHKGAA
ncbi:amine oxidase flavin-containing [Vibrio ichthyoenteri ATCC 700023]|uniref:Amine oxidase flavin-containing n=1 Tax=Vibrio ichthyoenteri ATCC 700023 TaxID=870968 RepID=F9S6W5_9VIBR|nr:FAD-dependent oxidoreductase [Vibrio ichthyoenteri]EGU32246.1 amine oxidase flavin-containing [Vibrio ichthyoenteri ATCC 700023]